MEKEGKIEEIKNENKEKNSFEIKNEFNLENIQEHYDSNPELKEKYVEDIIVHNQEKETILEVLVKNDGLNQRSIPTDEQYEVLKFLSAGEYPNCRNVVHVAGAYGGRAGTDYKKIDKLDSKVDSSRMGARDIGGPSGEIDYSAYFCSPWNAWFRDGGSAHIFRPEDLSDFLNDLTNKFFKMDVDEFMSHEIKKFLNDESNRWYGITEMTKAFYYERKFERGVRCNQVEENQIEKLYKKEIEYIYKTYACPSDHEKLLDELKNLDKSKTIGKFKKADEQGLKNLILYSVPKYLKLINDKTEKQGFKFVSEDDISETELRSRKLKEVNWAYSSRDSWNDYGFLIFSEIKDISLKFEDASIILVNRPTESSDGTKSRMQKVIFRFKK